MMPELEVELDRIATGGAALGRGHDGKIVFVNGGLPGELVTATVVKDHKTRVEADVAAIHRAAPGRTTPTCRHVADGCGGCDWQHASAELQRELRHDIVVDCLTRLAKLDDVDVRLGTALDPTGYRTSVRVAVTDGKVGFRASRSHDIVPVDRCLVAHPLVDELVHEGRFGNATEATIRVGARTGERLVIATPTADGVELPPDVVVIGDDDLDAGADVAYHEEVHGRRLRIGARSFFQCRPDGAEALIDAAAFALRGPNDTDGSGALLDAYCGVGLFGVGLVDGTAVERTAFDRVIGIESNRSAIADASHNYEAHGVAGHAVRVNVERWRPEPVAAVVADPSREGLGRKGAAKLAATEAQVIALVSCDPGSLARDVMALAGHGYRLDHVTVLDLFGHTSHVETVSRLVRR
jgi:23S rRNA (uracil1939-C5)-methyltransferase